MENPKIIDLKAKLEHPESIFVRFMRDAWQVTSRPEIVEKYFGGREFSISEIDPNFWSTVLKEALGCLNENRGYRGRAKQTVTLAKKPAKGDQVKSMWVSPHLAITVPIELLGDIKANLEKGVSQLKPLYEWVDKSSK